MQIRRTVLYLSDTLLARGYKTQADSLIQQGIDWANKFFILWFSLSSGKTNPKWVTDPPDHPSPSFSFPSFLFFLQANTRKYKIRHRQLCVETTYDVVASSLSVFSSSKDSDIRKNMCPHMLRKYCKNTLTPTSVCSSTACLQCVATRPTYIIFPWGFGSHIIVFFQLWHSASWNTPVLFHMSESMFLCCVPSLVITWSYSLSQ